MIASAVPWTNHNEFQFLRGLGTHSKAGVDRVQALRGYIEAANRRIRWGAIECDQAIDYAQKLLGGWRV